MIDNAGDINIIDCFKIMVADTSERVRMNKIDIAHHVGSLFREPKIINVSIHHPAHEEKIIFLYNKIKICVFSVVNGYG